MLHANERLAISVRDAAQMLSVSPRTIQKYITAGLLTARKIGHRTVIPMSSLEAFLRTDHPTLLYSAPTRTSKAVETRQ